MEFKFARKWTQVFTRLATQRKLISVFSLVRARAEGFTEMAFLQMALNLRLLGILLTIIASSLTQVGIAKGDI